MKTEYIIEIKNKFLSRYLPLTKRGFRTYEDALEFSRNIKGRYRIIEQTRKIKKISEEKLD